ncbi:Spy/CpxP family protein refolding chaperone [Bradyrhizobium sp. AUGA SZCCT0283]|uniref:Spy/CpxP family protein refolding chaperone n=1 Tax=Bradyrhizobium sp. AUGA SZCCT0283 TaxID=2807671 RepID=UPI001BACFC98|nr:Spy/CpxP family protein refolding chaperone [Bradyrhizobium sp. AUGA SZCCT0283]MBR1273328.1 Spy/CpxP family protein refolding chaperone [Bradyrhizobium sp. AUGA SZCCT0283]
MKKKVLLIGGVTAATLLAGGWALAQATGPGGFGPPFMRGIGHGSMGPGMMPRMHAMGSGMGPGMGAGIGPGMMGGAPGAFADPAQLETLKKELSITAAQEPAWTKYTKAVQDAATTMKTAREGVNPDTLGKLSPQDRFAFVSKMREQGLKQFETVKTAANELLTTLDDTQKAKAQTSLPGLAFGPGAMHAAGGPPFRH